MTHKLHKLPSRPAFSLVELLVVISIVTLLISLVLPSLQQAREVSYRVKCAANNRALATAGLNYAADNRLYGPPHSYSGSQFTWHAGTGGGSFNFNGNPIVLSGLDPYFNYTPDTAHKNKFYYRTNGCPTYVYASSSMQSFAFTANHHILGLTSSTSYNRWYRLDSPLLNPSATIFFMESNTDQIQNLSYLRARTLPLNPVSFSQRHRNEGLTFSFVDGHAQFNKCFDFTGTNAAPFEGNPILAP